MRRAFSSRLAYVGLMVWLAGSVLFLLVAIPGSRLNPQAPLVLGPIRAYGTGAIVAALLPALGGLAAFIGTVGRHRWGAYLLLAYSLFWLAILVGGLVEAIGRYGFAPAPGLTPWELLVAAVTLGSMVTGFGLLGVWSVQQMRAAATGQE